MALPFSLRSEISNSVIMRRGYSNRILGKSKYGPRGQQEQQQEEGSQPITESVLPQDDARVGYAADSIDDFRDESDSDSGPRLERGQAVSGERRRHRAFAIRHHYMDDSVGNDKQVPVGNVLQDVMRQVGVSHQRIDDVSPSPSSVEVQGGLRAQSTGVRPQSGPVTMGGGQHAVVVDADMMSMLGQVPSPRTTVSNTVSTPARQKRRQSPVVRQAVTRRRGGGPSRLASLSTQTNSQNLQDFVSAIPAPSPIDVSRYRMRTPSTLKQQVDTLDSRLQYLSSAQGRSVSTLMLKVLSVAIEQGKMKCFCYCESPMGVFDGHKVIIISPFNPDLADIAHQQSVPETKIVVSTPWLIVADDSDEDKECMDDANTKIKPNLPILLCLGGIQRVTSLNE